MSLQESHCLYSRTIIFGTAQDSLLPMVALVDLMKLPKTILERIQLVEQVMEKVQEETEEGPVLCDSCTAKALVKTSLPFGTLFFCKIGRAHV